MNAAVAQKAFDTTFAALDSDWYAGAYTAMLAHASRPVVETLAASAMCGCDLWSRSYGSVSISAYAGQVYPLSFLAEVHMPQAPNGPLVALLAFNKASPLTPWLVTQVVGYGGTNYTLSESPHIAMGAQRPSFGLVYDAIVLLRQLATLLESARVTGKPPPGNHWDAVLRFRNDELSAVVGELEHDHAATVRERLHDSITYTVADISPPFAAPAGTVVCSEILGYDVATSRSGKPVRQPANLSVFGFGLRAGTYSSVTVRSVRDACVIVSPQGRFGLVGIEGNVWLATGRRP